MHKPIGAGRAASVCAPWAVAAACLLTVSCAAAQRSKEQELALVQLTHSLSGHYDNLAQNRADLRAGTAPHEALALDIMRIDSPIMGSHAFYLQESASEDTRRIMRQQVITFELSADGKIRERIATLIEPRRWRDAPNNPELLSALVTEDIAPLSGCDLVWTRTGQGFAGLNDPDRCHAAMYGTEASARTEVRAELDATGLALLERSYDSDGRLVEGRAADAYYRFRRSAATRKEP